MAGEERNGWEDFWGWDVSYSIDCVAIYRYTELEVILYVFYSFEEEEEEGERENYGYLNNILILYDGMFVMKDSILYISVQLD